MIRSRAYGVEERAGLDGRWKLFEKQPIGFAVEHAQRIENQSIDLCLDVAVDFPRKLTSDKAIVMRALSTQFPRDQMRRVYAAIVPLRD